MSSVNEPKAKREPLPLGSQWAFSCVLNGLSVTVDVPDNNGGHPVTFENVQITFHNGMTGEQFAAEVLDLKTRLAGLARLGVEPRQRGVAYTPAPAIVTQPGTNAPAPTTPSTPPPPSPALTSGMLQCVMIEVGTQYQKPGVPQLLFHCNGEAQPLKYSMAVDKMAQLLAPVGFTAAHIVIGQKYQGNWKVNWQMNGRYKNVVSVAS